MAPPRKKKKEFPCSRCGTMIKSKSRHREVCPAVLEFEMDLEQKRARISSNTKPCNELYRSPPKRSFDSDNSTCHSSSGLALPSDQSISHSDSGSFMSSKRQKKLTPTDKTCEHIASLAASELSSDEGYNETDSFFRSSLQCVSYPRCLMDELSEIEEGSNDIDSIPNHEVEDAAPYPVEEVFLHPQFVPDATSEIPSPQRANENDACSSYASTVRAMDSNLGCVLKRPVCSKEYDMWKLQDKMTQSMLRLIDYCDQTSGNNRKFLDGLLKIIAEEMRHRDFKPEMAPKRETIVSKIQKQFGKGKEPMVGRFQVTSLSNPYLITEPDCFHYRKREILNCISFDIECQLLDLLNDRDIFGDPKNLVVNQDDYFSPYQGGCDDVLSGSWYSSTITRLKRGVADMEGIGFDEEFEFLLPLILYCDKTGTSDNQRYPLEPVVFTTALIRRHLRYYSRSWRVAGFIPDLESKSSSEHKKIYQVNDHAIPQSYHRFLSFILEGFEKVQRNGIITWLRIGDMVKRVRIRPEVAFVIQDGKSADMLTLRRGGCSRGCARISRACRTSQTNCDNVINRCDFITDTHLVGRDYHIFGSTTTIPDLLAAAGEGTSHVIKRYAEIVDRKAFPPGKDKPEEEEKINELRELAAGKLVDRAKQKLKMIGFHPVYNAFLARSIRFGFDPRNIWGATPVDLMHAFQSGILRYLTKMILDKLTPTDKTKLDQLVDQILGSLRSSEKDTFPRFSFTKGYSKLSMITSDEWVGKLFVLLLVAMTNEGRSILKKRFSSSNIKLPEGIFHKEKIEQVRDFQILADEYFKDNLGRHTQNAEDESNYDDDVNENTDKEDVVRKCSFFDFVELTEALLCFHAWYKMDDHEYLCRSSDRKKQTKVLHESMQRLLSMVRLYLPRKNGNQWKIQKFHDLLHLARDVERFGSPRNFDAGPLESMLRFWAKFPARTSQKRGYNTFVKQVADRLNEHQMLSNARRESRVKGIRDCDLPTYDAFSDVGKRKGHEVASATTAVDLVGGSSYVVPSTVYEGGSLLHTRQTGSAKRRKGYSGLHPIIENYLRDKCQSISCDVDHRGHKGWRVFTECKINLLDADMEAPAVTFRCHPNYGNEGEWYDWAIVHFDISEEEETSILQLRKELRSSEQYGPSCCPAKVLGFVVDPIEKKPHAVIHPCHYQDQRDIERGTVLTESWRLSFTKLNEENGQCSILTPSLELVSIDSIVARCFVVEEKPGIKAEVHPTQTDSKEVLEAILLVRKRQEWGDFFT